MPHVSQLPQPPTPEEMDKYRKLGRRPSEDNGYPSTFSEVPPGAWIDLRQPLPKPPQPKPEKQ